MKHIDDNRLQQPRNDLGDSAVQSVLPEQHAPRFELLKFENDKSDKIEREAERYGLKGVHDNEYAVQEAITAEVTRIKHRMKVRDEEVAALVNGLMDMQAASMMAARQSIANVQMMDTVPYQPGLDKLFAAAGLLMEMAALKTGIRYQPPRTWEEAKRFSVPIQPA